MLLENGDKQKALHHLEKALDLYDKVGVKKLIKQLKKPKNAK